MADFSSKVAFITGSAGGLGKEFARRLLRKGCRVGLADVKSDLGRATMQEFQKEFGREMVYFTICDVTSDDSIKMAVKFVCNHFKADQVDILVNNAGVMGEKEGWRLCMDINLTGVLRGTTLLALEGGMSKANGGRGGIVVNVASILGLFNGQQPKGWAYNTSKSGVVTFTRCVGSKAVEEETGLRFLCLCPSVAKTPILDGCTDEELKEMEKNVGGFMRPEQVGDAFMTMLDESPTGSVMAVWKDSPAFYIPDSGMNLFIFYTTCSMIFRFVPGFGRHTTKTIGKKEMAMAAVGIVVSWYFGFLLMCFLWDVFID